MSTMNKATRIHGHGTYANLFGGPDGVTFSVDPYLQGDAQHYGDTLAKDCWRTMVNPAIKSEYNSVKHSESVIGDGVADLIALDLSDRTAVIPGVKDWMDAEGDREAIQELAVASGMVPEVFNDKFYLQDKHEKNHHNWDHPIVQDNELDQFQPWFRYSGRWMDDVPEEVGKQLDEWEAELDWDKANPDFHKVADEWVLDLKRSTELETNQLWSERAEFAGEKIPVKVRFYSWGPKFAIGITNWGTCYIPKSMMEAARANMDDEGCANITMRPASGRHPFRATWINEQ